jgi:sRNA-binding carbon storage regulator CsrA
MALILSLKAESDEAIQIGDAKIRISFRRNPDGSLKASKKYLSVAIEAPKDVKICRTRWPQEGIPHGEEDQT